MSKAYKGQTKIKLVVDLETDITGATVKLKIESPGGNLEERAATIDDFLLGLVSFIPTIPDTPIVFPENGDYKAWAFVTYGDTRVAPGEPFDFKLHIEGY